MNLILAVVSPEDPTFRLELLVSSETNHPLTIKFPTSSLSETTKNQLQMMDMKYGSIMAYVGSRLYCGRYLDSQAQILFVLAPERRSVYDEPSGDDKVLKVNDFRVFVECDNQQFPNLAAHILASDFETISELRERTGQEDEHALDCQSHPDNLAGEDEQESEGEDFDFPDDDAEDGEDKMILKGLLHLKISATANVINDINTLLGDVVTIRFEFDREAGPKDSAVCSEFIGIFEDAPESSFTVDRGSDSEVHLHLILAVYDGCEFFVQGPEGKE